MPHDLHLDTNILIFGIDPNHSVHRRLRDWQSGGARITVSAMAWAEFRCGPLTPGVLAAWERIVAGRVVPVSRLIAERAADLFNLAGRRAHSLPDCVIAATAMQGRARLATLNLSDFRPFVSYGLLLA